MILVWVSKISFLLTMFVYINPKHDQSGIRDGENVLIGQYWPMNNN